MIFPYRRVCGSRPDLTGQRLGLCVVDSKAPSVNDRQRWRIRCQAITPDRDQCGGIFYLETSHVRVYQRPGNELFACPACRAARRAARRLVRFSCEGCSASVEMRRKRWNQRVFKDFCRHCAQKIGRLHSAAAGRHCSECGEAGHNRLNCQERSRAA